MAYYLVRARPRADLSAELRGRLDRGELLPLRPFGQAITTGVAGARRDPATGDAIWEEEDYWSPPLAMERVAVLDRYFDGPTVESVERGEAWRRIEGLPSLWEARS